jgi:hypothetical protein
MKHKVVDVHYFEKLSPVFQGKWGRQLARLVIHFLAIDRVNKVYGRSCQYTGAAFTEGLLTDFGVNYRIGYAERLQHLPEGAFITVSNHPYGALDGIMLIHMMASIRPDYKIMVNQILTLIEAMNENFISVKPRIGDNPLNPSASFSGVKEALLHLSEGHPMGFFPAGGVSFFDFKTMSIHDREWQESILKLIYKANVPVIPIRFFDGNSPFFYFLGIISWRIRSLRMAYEVFNKKRHKPRIGIGETITPEKIRSFNDVKELGLFLRRQVYEMKKPTTWTPRMVIPLQREHHRRRASKKK